MSAAGGAAPKIAGSASNSWPGFSIGRAAHHHAVDMREMRLRVLERGDAAIEITMEVSEPLLQAIARAS